MIALVCLISATVLPLPCKADLKSDFVHPLLKFRSRPLWFWNNTAVTAAGVEAELRGNRDRSGYRAGLADYNAYLGRLNLLLQGPGRHVADIAVLYPIATLQAGYHFDGPLNHYVGGVNVPEAGYVCLGELLSTRLARDFTFLHPDALDEQCSVKGNRLRLNNKINREEYRVLILPGHRTIRWSNLKKIKQSWDNGGTVIATGELPSKSAEFGHDAEVVATIYLNSPNESNLRQALALAQSVGDVEIESNPGLRYIHRVRDKADVYSFANVGAQAAAAAVQLRGKIEPEAWDPHTGKFSLRSYAHAVESGQSVTRLKLSLEPAHSLFIVGKRP
jgi:hypothetical protein